MLKVTIEDCMKTEDDNRFEIIIAASKRAHQLNKGYQSTVPEEGDKPAIIAMREIAAGTQDIDNIISYEEDIEVML